MSCRQMSLKKSMYLSTLASVSKVTGNRLVEEFANEMTEDRVELERGDEIGFDDTLSVE